MNKASSPSVAAEFERHLWFFHYLTVSCVCQQVAELEVLAAKSAISLLRWADIYPADKAFYDAGTKSKVNKQQYTLLTILFIFLLFFVTCLLIE